MRAGPVVGGVQIGMSGLSSNCSLEAASWQFGLCAECVTAGCTNGYIAIWIVSDGLDTPVRTRLLKAAAALALMEAI